ncbi:MAG TPA: GNAT family N-acetyltransferase [Caulobacteraceae bacterium]|nr:GNAT family N-acetyltransferase [Caulobacteraceae bacterium]
MNASLIEPDIVTERLRLRRPAETDAPAIARLASDYAISSMTTRMPYPYDLADARAFIGYVQALDPAREAVFAIEHRDAGLIGCLGFHRDGAGRLELGYWLGRPYWGKGLATEATKAALKWAARDWGRRIVYSGHFADNAASGGVLVKSGFIYTGVIEPRFSRARREPVATRMMVWLA